MSDRGYSEIQIQDDIEEGDMLEESEEIIDGQEHQGHTVTEQQFRLEEAFQLSAS